MVSGPGGVGKSTVVKALVDRYPELWLSRSWTTRERRPSESPEAYVFVTVDEFEKRIADDGFLEYAEFLGNYYGTPVLEDTSNRDVILEIDVQGARQVLEREPEAVLIFLQAPSESEQQARLRRRGDPEEKVAQRLQKAAQEANAGRELGAQIITNFDIDETVELMWAVIEKARAATGRTGM
ncbi:MAG: guanylate kinase [Acidimicrobiia bacterium]|nr:guanylate kinase [Acidimicrobiia bacterium]